MNILAINEAHKAPRIGSLATVSGALLLCAAGPAFSADLPPYDDAPSYRPSYYRSSDYNTGCYRCSCCGRRFVRVAEPPPPLEERDSEPVLERDYVERPVERHWVQRDYIERRYPSYGTRYAYPSRPVRHRYSYYYPGADAEPGYDARPRSEPPWRRAAYRGAPYPAEYEYAPKPSAPYRYVASSRPYDYRPGYEYEYYRPSTEYRPTYDYEASPRPPATVPSSYYGSGYPE